VQRHAPQVLTLAGCGPLCAAKLLVETADVRRFKSDAAFAMHAGVAPIPASSGKVQRHRLNRGGNRQLNAALHRIAVTQLRVNAPAQAFRQRRLTAGSTRAEALRALKRHQHGACITCSTTPSRPSTTNIPTNAAPLDTGATLVTVQLGGAGAADPAAHAGP
jgi:transposase